ncbi:hypothetical protein NE619_10215 [Anaerovorax odorimutans]|uniref:Uncharacterized protein n=1 Tax=Anaerovorax odorimutans TaxID=109327 RepID=A0ABT1RPH9_9FIRM|nr:hypothetical protein [Anaerovorax odorimutans]MCQ4637100.1 hypothetical protein [Anaerovorax odorimutans]
MNNDGQLMTLGPFILLIIVAVFVIAGVVVYKCLKKPNQEKKNINKNPEK